jgi:hypothetical protein
VDVTLAGDLVKMPRWLFLPFASPSDHSFLYFEVESKTALYVHPLSQPHFRPARLDKQLFHKFLGNQLSTLSGSLDLTSESSVILEIETLTSIIVKCARAARIRTAPLSFSAKNLPWWSRELCALRTKTRKAFKVWSHDKSESNRASYKTAKSIYQRNLRKAKNRTWSCYRTTASNSDTFKALSSFTGKCKFISLPETIIINGELVSDPSVIVEHCTDHFFPSKRPSMAAHAETERLVETALSCPVSTPVPLISDWEFNSGVSSLNPDSSPGNNGQRATHLILCIPSIQARLIAILNACLLLCFFPVSWKSVKVTIIGKPNKKSYDYLQNFRPIGLGSNLAKILEKMILGRLNWHADSTATGSVRSNMVFWQVNLLKLLPIHLRLFLEMVSRSNTSLLPRSLTLRVPSTLLGTLPLLLLLLCLKDLVTVADWPQGASRSTVRGTPTSSSVSQAREDSRFESSV